MLGATEKGNATNLCGRIFDTLGKLNFRVESDKKTKRGKGGISYSERTFKEGSLLLALHVTETEKDSKSGRNHPRRVSCLATRLG